MCGIVGIWSPLNGGLNSCLLDQPLKAIHHRGPDDSGKWIDPNRTILFGHTRLSILDLTHNGHQPMQSKDGRWVIVFNGEIYNWRELQKLLSDIGVRFEGHSDTEVLIEAIAYWGLDVTLEHLVGMFAFALWDQKEKRLYIARDRFGEKPFYYGFQKHQWLFSSELKSLRAFNGFNFPVDEVGLAYYFKNDYIPAPYSIYSWIKKIKPGCYLELKANGETNEVTYWDFHRVVAKGVEYQKQHFPDFESVVEETVSLLKAAVSNQMVADVPVGAFLSGGLDSTAIVALMKELNSSPVHTFSIGFNEAAYDESAHAAVIAKYLGTHHTELRVQPEDSLNVISQLPTIYDEPFADSSVIPTYLVSQLARHHVTVALTGDSGDEIFGGYGRYLSLKRSWERVSSSGFMWSGFNNYGSRVAEKLSLGLRAYKWSERFQKRGNLFACPTMAAVYDLSMSRWPEARRWLMQIQCHAPYDWVKMPYHYAMATDTIGYLPGNNLMKIDRAAMSVGLETRVPMLDHRLVEYLWSQPEHYKIHQGETKRLLRAFLYKKVPRELLDRPKMGFGVPIRDWLRGSLKKWAEELLFDLPIEHPAAPSSRLIYMTWRGHQKGKIDASYRLWNLLMYQAWRVQWQM